MLECIPFDNEPKYVEAFLSLPNKLYKENENMEDRSTTKKILLGRHPLSEYFKVYKFLIYKAKELSGRFILTQYPKDDTLYLGFFECVDNKEVADYLFYNVEHFAKLHGFKKIVGPVDASFWVKYRLKINKFDKPYTGEPYNKDYYYDMFLSHGYSVAEHYTSNIFPVVDRQYKNDKLKDRLNRINEQGYVIKSPQKQDFNKVMDEVYDMIIDLYKDFPVFKKIRRETFMQLFNNYKYILDYRMVKMAYYNGESVGFFISTPDYSNVVYHLDGLSSVVNANRIKNNPPRYIMLYLGAKKKHPGVGAALSEVMLEELQRLQVPSIGALMKDGKMTQNFAKDLAEGCYEYVLLEKEIERRT